MVYRRYASLFFIAGCSSSDNELATLEIVHRYVEQMDKYYGNVCELDIIFNFQKAYFILDELLLAGEMQESSKKNVLRCISQQDSLEDMEVSIFRSDFTSGLKASFPKHPTLSMQTPNAKWKGLTMRPLSDGGRGCDQDYVKREHPISTHTPNPHPYPGYGVAQSLDYELLIDEFTILQ